MKKEEEKIYSEARKIYKKLKRKLEPEGKGKVIGIEVKSGQYIVGENELESYKIKIPESIRGGKEVQESLNFAYDSVKINGVKEEVLKSQFVTTS